jgi:hypothetical protein
VGSSLKASPEAIEALEASEDLDRSCYTVLPCLDGFPEMLIRRDGRKLSLDEELRWLRAMRAIFEKKLGPDEALVAGMVRQNLLSSSRELEAALIGGDVLKIYRATQFYCMAAVAFREGFPRSVREGIARSARQLAGERSAEVRGDKATQDQRLVLELRAAGKRPKTIIAETGIKKSKVYEILKHGRENNAYGRLLDLMGLERAAHKRRPRQLN